MVSTCCYIARQYGVRSAMPMFKALKACPEAVVIKPDFTQIRRRSERIFGAVGELTPLVQTLSLDEAWIDLSGTERLNGGPPALQLIRLQKQIEDETGLTVSIGLAPNRFLAKIASELDKPRGFSVDRRARRQAFLAPKPVRILPGVGPVVRQDAGQRRLRHRRRSGRRRRARSGQTLRRDRPAPARPRPRPRRPRRSIPTHDRKGMSAETTFNEDLTAAEDLEAELWPLCEKLASKARRDGVASRVVVLKLRRTDFKIITRRITLPEPVQTARALFAVGRELLAPELGRPYRLIGIGMADVSGRRWTRPPACSTRPRRRALKTETAIDALRAEVRRRRRGGGAGAEGQLTPPFPHFGGRWLAQRDGWGLADVDSARRSLTRTEPPSERLRRPPSPEMGEGSCEQSPASHTDCESQPADLLQNSGPGIVIS